MGVPMSYFFNSTSETTDARVAYDRTYDRFIVITWLPVDNLDISICCFAISTSGDATGPYIHYAAYFSVPAGDYIDYPQLVSTNTEVQESYIYASGSSDDFNPSIAANDAGAVFVLWSSPQTRLSD